MNEPIYNGPLEYVVRHVLQIAKERLRAGKPEDADQLMSDLIPLLPVGSVKAETDCEKCRKTPCECGWGYRTWSKESRVELAAAVLGVKPEELAGVPVIHPMLAPAQP